MIYSRNIPHAWSGYRSYITKTSNIVALFLLTLHSLKCNLVNALLLFYNFQNQRPLYLLFWGVARSFITCSGLLLGAKTAFPTPPWEGVSTGSCPCLYSMTGLATFRPETPARKATINTYKLRRWTARQCFKGLYD